VATGPVEKRLARIGWRSPNRLRLARILTKSTRLGKLFF